MTAEKVVDGKVFILADSMITQAVDQVIGEAAKGQRFEVKEFIDHVGLVLLESTVAAYYRRKAENPGAEIALDMSMFDSQLDMFNEVDARAAQAFHGLSGVR